MPLKLTPPVEETYKLERTDKRYESSGTTVTIRQATQRQHERRQDLFAKTKSSFYEGSDEISLEQRFNLPEQHRIEVMLTMSACNIEDSNGKALFKFKNDKLNMTEAAFADAYGSLPLDVTAEIHDCVIKCNPDWDRRGEA